MGRALTACQRRQSSEPAAALVSDIRFVRSQHDIRAALYAPLRVLVYEQGEGHTIVEYDQPSSQFGQFGLTDVTQVAMTLDVKLERVLVQAAELSR